jgi:tetratricopeptide (TPR) repeat protein
MPAKPFFRALVAALALAASGVAASAQVTQLTGKVTLKQPDGTEAPVQNAVIDIYRTDISGKWQVKTDKKGVYTHAGLPFVGTFTIVVSAPGARPTYQTKVRVSQRPEIHFTLEPGDGSRPTLEQVNQFESGGGGGAAAASPAAGGGSTGRRESAEEKAKREEMEAKIKEIEAKNAKIASANETVARAFKAGNEALQAKNYDAAIAQYDEGLAARDEVALFANKSVALRLRGADKYNQSIQAADQAAKASGLAAANEDWKMAAETAKKGIEAAKTAEVPADATAKTNYEQNRIAVMGAYAEAMKLVATKGDKSQAEEGFKAYTEYAALETDPAKKAQKTADAAKILFEAGAYDRAAEEYQKILAADPENVEANLYLGFSLFNTGDKAKFQEAANFLGAFSAKAADTHPLKADVKSILEYLKSAENVKPEKVQPARPAGRRRP